MYYIQTADRLTRTSVWLENMEGGVDQLRDVVVHDKLGICADLERRLQYLVDTYKCEWTEVVNDPERRKAFSQFVNTDETEVGIEIITERSQNRPADWAKDGQLVQLQVGVPPLGGNAPAKAGTPTNTNGHAGNGHAKTNGRPKPREDAQPQWVAVGRVADFPLEGGAAIKYGQVQIAVFHFTSRGQWYATQNMCPHKRAFVLSRGIIGSQGEVPKVACPLHKKTFSLESGECLSGDEMSVKVFPVKVIDDQVYLQLPPHDQLNALLATELHCVTACEAVKVSATNADLSLPALVNA
jgi:nitrite reductase (NADH) large subunit